MAELKAGSWLIAVLMYFTFFILIVNSVSDLSSDSYNSTITNNDFSSLTANKICSNPRYYVNSNQEIKSYNNWRDSRLDCIESKGVFSQSECEKIEGCSWSTINATSYFFGLFSIDGQTTCTGYINASYYNVDSSDGKHVDSHKTSQSNLWGLAPIWSNSPCFSENVLFNHSSCNTFGCSWTDYDSSENLKATNFISTFGTIFSFSYDFGMTNSGLKLFFNLLFVFVPLLIILFATYFLIR